MLNKLQIRKIIFIFFLNLILKLKSINNNYLIKYIHINNLKISNTFRINCIDLLLLFTFMNKILLVTSSSGIASSFPSNSSHIVLYDNNAGNISNEINYPDEQVLIYRLLRNYDPAARPVFNASKIVTVKFSFSLIQICDLV